MPSMQQSLRNQAEAQRDLNSFGVWELEMPLPKTLGSGSAGFLNPDDISAKGTTVTIVELPAIVDSEFKDREGKPQKRCRVTVKLAKGEPKPWTMNNRTYKKCIAAFGTDESGWKGKKILVIKVKQMVRDELKDVLYGEPAT
jgi:hypothetical protein